MLLYYITIYYYYYINIIIIIRSGKLITSNAMNHLDSHNLFGNIKKRKRQNNELYHNEERVGPDPIRYFRLLAANIVIENNLPLTFVESDSFRLFAYDIPGCNNDHRTALKHHIVEYYLQLIDDISKDLKAVKEDLGIPFLCTNLDLWTCTVLRKKFVGIHGFYVDNHFQRKDFCLGVKVYSPDRAVLTTRIDDNGDVVEVAMPQISDLLLKWLQHQLSDYGLTLDDICSTTSDHGSDVTRCFQTCLQDEAANETKWDWCIPHLLHKALAQGFSSEGAQNLLDKMKKVIERVNKSSTLLEALRALISTILRNDGGTRWGSKGMSLQSFLLCWDPLNEIINDSDFNFSTANKKLYSQIYSVIKVVTDIIVLAQNTKDVCACEVLVELYRLKNQHLNSEEPLVIVDPNEAQGQRFTRDQYYAVNDINPIVQRVRDDMLKAIGWRFFDHYWTNNESRSYSFDMCMALQPLKGY